MNAVAHLRLTLVLSLAAFVAATVGCGPRVRGLEVAGDVRAGLDVVTAPALSAPATPTPQEAAAGAKRPLVAGKLARVYVRPGDRVTEGQRIAEFDTTIERLDVSKARAGREAAVAQVKDVRERIDDVRDELRELDRTERRLEDTRERLLRAQRRLEAAPAGAGSAARPGAGVEPPSGAGARLARLAAEEERVRAGLQQVRSGLARIREGRQVLNDAMRRLEDAERLFEVGSDARTLAVDAAEDAVARATLRAPSAGLVTFAAATGEVLNVGAPVAKLQPDAPALVDVYVPAAEAEAHDVGHRAEVRLDSLPDRVFRGRVVQVGSVDEFPPTRYPTKVVHMTRAVRLTIRLQAGSGVPRGVPVDVVLY